MARTSPISPRIPVSKPQTEKQRPLVRLICEVNAYREENSCITYAWHHLSYLWEIGKISNAEAFAAIAAGPLAWDDFINQMNSPYKQNMS